MNFTYENQGTHTYLVYTFAEEDVVDSMSLGMLTNNKIPGLAQALFMQFDAVKCVKYDVSAKLSAKQFFAGPVSKKRLLGVFNGIVDALRSAEEYMIDTNTLLLDLDYIFTDVSTCDTVMVCLPVVPDDLAGSNLKEFFKNIMFTTQFDQTENCDHVAKIINYLNSAPVFSIDEFKKVLETLKQDVPVTVVQRPVQQPVQPNVAAAPKAQPTVPQPAQKPVQKVAEAPKPVQQPAQKAAAPQPAQKPAPQPAQKPAPQVQAQATAAKPAEKMSWFYLMQHYNKENAAIYKAQQEAAKRNNAAPASAPAQPAKDLAFAVPGQPAKPSFAIPGQPAPAPEPKTPMPKAAPAPQPASKPLPNPVYAAAKTPQGQAANFGDTTILDNNTYDGTTILNAEPVTQVKPYLIRVKNKERFTLDKAVCQIGSERSFADYYIGDNRAISRSHATIINRNGEYFVTDNNSTNHTYVDDNMIQSNQEVKLSHGTKLRLANEEFEFRSY